MLQLSTIKGRQLTGGLDNSSIDATFYLFSGGIVCDVPVVRILKGKNGLLTFDLFP
jgi:hypothetical protein